MKGTHRIRPLATLIVGVGFVLTLLLLTVYRAWGTSPAITKQQATLSESYTLTLTANPDVTAICRGKQVAFTASLRCTDPYGVATNETVRINVVSGSGTDASGYGSVSTSVTGIQHGKDKIAVTATGDGLSRSRSIDVINVAIESGATSCVHKANAQLEIDTTQSYSPGDGYGWFVAPDEGLCTTTVTGETFTYYPTNSKPGIYTVTAKSVTLPACQGSCTVHVVKVDLAVAGVASTNKGVAPGGLICVTNGPGQTATRTALTINKCDPTGWDGSVELLWTAGNIKVYNAATGGVEVTSGTTFANTALPTNLWVEGTASSAAAGDVVFRLNPVGLDCPREAEGCDRVVMTVIKVDTIQYKLNGAWSNVPSAGFNNICLGSQIEFKAMASPSSVTWPSGSPIWGGDASGNGGEKSVVFSISGNREITASCGNTVIVKVHVANANTAQTVGWSHGYVSDNNTASSTTIERPFNISYTACADVANNLWHLRICSITGGTDIAIHMGGFKTPNPGVNITNASEGTVTINDMLLESSPSGPATTWVTEDAIRTHEEWHRDEWVETSEHYWPATETAIESIMVPYHLYVNDVATAVAAMRAGGNGADAKNAAYKAKCHDYWFTLGDSPGDRPYRAGGVVLNLLIEAIRAYGSAQTPPWSGLPAGTNAGPGTDHCYQPWLPYSP